MDIHQLYGFIAELEKAHTENELNNICQKFCNSAEIPFYLMGVISHKSLCNPKLNFITNHPDKLLKPFYIKNKKIIDPIVLHIISKSSPVRWEELVEQEKIISKAQQHLMKEAKLWGLHNGLSIPIRSGTGEIGIMCLGINLENEAGIRLLDTALPYAHTFSMHLFEKYRGLLADEDVLEFECKLTGRERECLFWVCEGKTTWEIAQILKITERTVGFHLNNSATKLGASNRQHTVAIAIRKGLIQPNILDIDIAVS